MIPDANFSYLVKEALYQFAPFGSMELVGIILLLCVVYLFWGYGISFVSGTLLGFLALAVLSMAFGGVFTLVFYSAIIILGLLLGLVFFSRMARGSA